MLSRVADALYWMSRYLERAENMSRFVEVNWHLSLEQPQNGVRDWGALVSVTGDNDTFLKRYDTYSRENVITFLFFDTRYPHSVMSCLRAARENARTVREIISSDMWEQINSFYHFVEDMGKRPSAVHDNPFEFCRPIQLRGMMIDGIANGTMLRGEAWHFIRMGRHLERADKTSRILDVKYFSLLPGSDYADEDFDDVQWAALLRASGGLEAYRRRCGRIFPAKVADFLIFNDQFARSIIRCLNAAKESLYAICGPFPGIGQKKAEQRMGALCAEIAYTDINAVFEHGLHEFMDQLQLKINRVNDRISKAFFAYDAEPGRIPSGPQTTG